MAAQALGARLSAAALLTNTIREINRYKVKPDKRKRLLQSKLDKLCKEKDDLFTKDCLYVDKADKAGLDLDDDA